MSLNISAHEKDGVQLVSVVGEVDVSNAPQLRTSLEDVLAQNPSAIEVDLSEVPYIDSTGIGVLVGTAHRAEDKGVDLVVSHPQRNVARVLNLLGVGPELNLRLDEAE
ncbi:MAG: STAS domain-containing protein [Atopobiaceae bacterium]|jgi:anti-sigma B factor antagonist